MTETFLLPTDFSDAANIGVRAGAELAERLGASVVLVHVFDSEAIGAPPPTLGWSAEKDAILVAEVREKIEEHLAKEKARFPEAVQVRTVLLDDASAPRAIADYARDNGVDLIVISTHGRTGFGRFLLGSVTEKIVRLADCRVLTVPARPAEP